MLDTSVIDEAVAEAALDGLLAPRKTLPPKLFYDDEGCRLFGEITRLPEYYPTRTELALLRRIAPEIGAGLPPGSALVEYGGSDEMKAEILLEAAPAIDAYVPIDVAGGALDALSARLRASRPDLDVHPLVADFMAPIRLPKAIAGRHLLGFFPGSTIGNLDPAQARAFLAAAGQTLGQGATFVVGVDLRKDPAILVPAYDDAQGVTAAFNRNLLHRLNRDAAADFDPAGFAHSASWNDAQSRIEMHLVSLRRQSVTIAGHQIFFAAGETIHTENSYKYSLAAFDDVVAESGAWRPLQRWTDPAGLFSLHLLEAAPATHRHGGFAAVT